MLKRCTIITYILFSLTTASAQAPYFQGKTIKIVRGGEPGGTGDMQARAVIPFLRKHIPGNPTIIVENMPGAAGRKAANHIYSTAKPDGLSIGAVGAGLVAGQILELAGSQYDIDKLIYLGSTESGDPTCSSDARTPGSILLRSCAPSRGSGSAPKPWVIRSMSAAGYSPICSA
ncbi:MAG: hypothetical protein ACXW6T_02840 [Candidatus Binatia bacterium]